MQLNYRLHNEDFYSNIEFFHTERKNPSKLWPPCHHPQRKRKRVFLLHHCLETNSSSCSDLLFCKHSETCKGRGHWQGAGTELRTLALESSHIFQESSFHGASHFTDISLKWQSGKKKILLKDLKMLRVAWKTFKLSKVGPVILWATVENSDLLAVLHTLEKRKATQEGANQCRIFLSYSSSEGWSTTPGTGASMTAKWGQIQQFLDGKVLAMQIAESFS